jgi:catechol-2,3-dioxygenase
MSHANDPAGVVDPHVRVSRLGFIGFETQDVDRLVDYYVNVLGLALVQRDPSAAYLTTGPDHHCVTIVAGGPRAGTHLGFQIEGPLEQAERRLQQAGIPVERRSDPQPGVSAALVIEEPGGTPLYLYETQSGSGQRSTLGPSASKLGHVASFVSDLGQSQRFYEETLGFRWSDTIGDFFTFLRCGPDHHTVNFLAQSRPAGMHHVAYEARDIAHLKDMLDQLARHGITLEWGVGRHGVGHNIFSYHRDPDGNMVELFTELDRIIDERTGRFEPRPWHEEHPQHPRVWEATQPTANMWGPLSTAMSPEGMDDH